MSVMLPRTSENAWLKDVIVLTFQQSSEDRGTPGKSPSGRCLPEYLPAGFRCGELNADWGAAN